MNETKLITQLLEKLIKSDIAPEEIQLCPICKGELHVGFGAYKRGKQDLLGATAECRSCGTAVAIDYAGIPPAWIK
jgi:hypothetical protein